MLVKVVEEQVLLVVKIVPQSIPSLRYGRIVHIPTSCENYSLQKGNFCPSEGEN